MWNASKTRSLIKTVSYRILGTAITVACAWLLTRRVDLVVILGVIELVIKPIFYYLHERVWNQADYGRSVKQQELEEMMDKTPEGWLL